jgi:putative transcriptional regulator
MKAGVIMPIKYDKLLKLLNERGYTTYRIKKENIIGQATFKKIKDGGDIDTRTIAKLCALLDCQPGDIMEYVEEQENNE